MHLFEHHIFICTQQGQDVKCHERGGAQLYETLRKLLFEYHLEDRVLLTACGCLHVCDHGPNLVIYPEGIWISQLNHSRLREVITAHLLHGHATSPSDEHERERCSQNDPIQEPKPIACMELYPDRKARMPSHLVEALHANINRHYRRMRDREAHGILPDPLRELAEAFRASRVLLTAVEFDLFSVIGDGASAISVAENLGTDPKATELLLNALASLGLIQKTDTVFSNSIDANRYLRQGAPYDVRSALMHYVHSWDRWSTLTESVREGNAMNVDSRSGLFSTASYLEVRNRLATLAVRELLSLIKITSVHRILDVGGGAGAYLVQLLNQFPSAEGELFELPDVIRIASRLIQGAGLSGRITLRKGDFTVDPFGREFDLVILSKVMHEYSREVSKRLLQKTFAALIPGGRILINDYILNESQTHPRTAVLQALNVLVSTRSGHVFPENELRALLIETGFGDIQLLSIAGATDVMTAIKP